MFSFVLIRSSGVFPGFIADNNHPDSQHDSRSRNVVMRNTNTELGWKNHLIHGQQSSWTTIFNETSCDFGNFTLKFPNFIKTSLINHFSFQFFYRILELNWEKPTMTSTWWNRKRMRRKLQKTLQSYGKLSETSLIASCLLHWALLIL